MTIHFIFLDGVGLGEDAPGINPLAGNCMPAITRLLGGKQLLRLNAPLHSPLASLLALDAQLGVDGLPQSATGQAALITGANVPAGIGYHYGPKPDPPTAAFLSLGGLFGELTRAGKKVRYLNAYPQRYFDTINSGKHMYSSFPLAAINGGLRLLTADALRQGDAVSADITGEGWATHLHIPDIPVRDPFMVGQQIAITNQLSDLTFFEYWATDYTGHKQNMPEALRILAEVDAMIDGIHSRMTGQDLILVTSDHGNIEDLAVRRHTSNPVPLLLIGAPEARQPFIHANNITDIAPVIRMIFKGNAGPF